MKLHLLHGPAINSSRQKLTQFKKEFDPNNVVVFDNTSKVEDVLGEISTIPLIDEPRLIIWENPSEDFNYTLYTIPYTLILWFDHEVSASKPIMGWAKKHGQVYFFPEAKEVSIFPFLDCLGSKDKRAFLEMDKLKKEGYEDQYLITMILYLLRNLVATPKGAKDFVKRKNEKMRSNFSKEELINLYKSVLEIDFKIKSGLLEIPQAEFLLVEKFINLR